jgi:DNA-binding Lrp family transcriptional regulator
MVQVQPGADANDVHSKLHAIQGVKTVHFVAGPTDVIAFVEEADEAALAKTIQQFLTVKGVQDTDTRIVLPI